MKLDLNKYERKILNHLLKKEIKKVQLYIDIDKKINGPHITYEWIGLYKRQNTLVGIRYKLRKD